MTFRYVLAVLTRCTKEKLDPQTVPSITPFRFQGVVGATVAVGTPFPEGATLRRVQQFAVTRVSVASASKKNNAWRTTPAGSRCVDEVKL